MTRRTALLMPDLGFIDQLMRASVWLVERGAAVEAGDPLLEVVAGAAVVDIPAPATGVLAAKLVAEDEPIHVGQRLAVIEADDGM